MCSLFETSFLGLSGPLLGDVLSITSDAFPDRRSVSMVLHVSIFFFLDLQRVELLRFYFLL